jgi:hypothetical protein
MSNHGSYRDWWSTFIPAFPGARHDEPQRAGSLDRTLTSR